MCINIPCIDTAGAAHTPSFDTVNWTDSNKTDLNNYISFPKNKLSVNSMWRNFGFAVTHSKGITADIPSDECMSEYTVSLS